MAFSVSSSSKLVECTSSSEASRVLESASETVVYPSLPIIIPSQESAEMGHLRPQIASKELASKECPSTPSRPSPNIAKRRGGTPSLVRTVPSPGHSSKMAQIFQDAQASLQSDWVGSSTPSRRLSSNTRRTRIPRLQLQQGTLHDHQLPPIMAGAQSIRSTTPSEIAPTSKLPPIYANTPPELPCSPLYPTPQPVFSSEMDTASLIMSEPISSGFATSVEPESRRKVREGLPTLPHANQSPESLSAMPAPKENLSPHEHAMESLLHSSPSFCLPMRGPNLRRRVIYPTQRDEVLGVDAWLKDIPEVSPGNTPSVKRVKKVGPPKQTRRTPPWRKEIKDIIKDSVPSARNMSPGKIPQRPRSSSNKENQSPLKDSPVQDTGLPRNVLYRYAEQPAYPPKTPHQLVMEPLAPSKTPSSYRFTDYRDEGNSTMGTEQAMTPRGLFSHPPRRKRQKASVDLRLSQLPTRPENSFVIAEDEEAVTLSPDVEPYRKENRPRRNRCVSYFDEDVIVSPTARKTAEGRVEERNTGINAHKGREVLGESIFSGDSTKPKAFMEGVEDCEFFGEQDQSS